MVLNFQAPYFRCTAQQSNYTAQGGSAASAITLMGVQTCWGSNVTFDLDLTKEEVGRMRSWGLWIFYRLLNVLWCFWFSGSLIDRESPTQKYVKLKMLPTTYFFCNTIHCQKKHRTFPKKIIFQKTGQFINATVLRVWNYLDSKQLSWQAMVGTILALVVNQPFLHQNILWNFSGSLSSFAKKNKAFYSTWFWTNKLSFLSC